MHHCARPVAKELVRFGAKHVQTCDLYAEAAQIDGCTYVENWAESKCDFLVPCANSLAITEEVAASFHKDVKYCVGATNSPFASQEARDIFDKVSLFDFACLSCKTALTPSCELTHA